jgi:hypothetical protein
MTYIAIPFTVVALIIMAALLLNPLRRSEKSIRRSMLKLTPVGTSMKDVIGVIESNENWDYHIQDNGYIFARGTPYRGSPINTKSVVGVKSIVVYIGQYRAFFLTDVSVFYAFDEDSKLIDIAVLKETDSL